MQNIVTYIFEILEEIRLIMWPIGLNINSALFFYISEIHYGMYYKHVYQ